ncbi:MAG TPA: tRNA (guanosine(37)-N1)-methyltransferase TrmD [Acidimicrobiales bacterium]|jgi:tRNA (guanine37-N1)-methyltransferase|nr:tRNA (guanosine(37)-N1)-methyltransferase TrmD [Acidimicrobiales bacterium]
MTLRVDVLTLFPDAVAHYATTSVLGRAAERGVWSLHLHDFRDATTDVHRSVDDTPFGGGAGMVLRAEPIISTIESETNLARPVIALTPSGRVFTHDVARELSMLTGFTLLSGRYEGFDQRALDLVVDDEVSLGDFVLAGGELAALCVIESVVRLLPGALGNDDSSVDESFSHGLLEYPQYTKPAVVRGEHVPEVLLSGDHARIERWRHAQALRRTMERRPDLMVRRGGLSAQDHAILAEFPTLDEIERNG